MAKYKIFGTTSKELTLPTTKPETSLDFVNSQCIDPSYTFTRNSSGTYVGDDGLIKTAAINEPRFEFDVLSGEYKGLLIEEARTNQLTYSNTFDVDWTDTNITRESTSNLAPDGTNTALRVLASQNNATIIRNSAIGSNNTRTFSIFLRRVNGSGDIQFTFNGGSTWNTISQPITSTWSRILVFTNTTNHRVGLRLTTQGDSIELWGSQLEIGSSMTSYIPTVGSTVTRQPDQLVLNKTLNPQGAFYIEPNTNTNVSTLVADNGTSILVPPQGTKSALFYNTSRTLSMSSSITPFGVNFNVPQNLNRVSLGFNRLNNTNYINGHLKKFMYYGSPVTEDNLRSLNGNTRPTFRFDREQIITDGLVLLLDAGNPASYPPLYLDADNPEVYPKDWGSGWSGSFGDSSNSFDGNLSTATGSVGGTFSATYTFSGGLKVLRSARVCVNFGATLGQVGGRTNVILVNGIDISQKMRDANLYAANGNGWIDVSSEVGSTFNTIVLNGTSGSTNPSISAIEVDGKVLINDGIRTTWTDLSGFGNNGTLVNGVGYSSDNLGSLVFDGVDDYVSGSITPLTGNYTIEIIFKLIKFNPSSDNDLVALTSSNSHGFLGEIRSSDGKIRFLHRFPYGVGGGDSFYSSGSINLNQIYSISWVRDSNQKVYINGIFDSQITSTNSGFNSNLTQLTIGQLLQNNSARIINGNVYSTKIYNRALTAAEIAQNFNALRSRYGI
jgi:hypothetical protein